jgi:exonuclease VII small subunit
VDSVSNTICADKICSTLTWMADTARRKLEPMAAAVGPTPLLSQQTQQNQQQQQQPVVQSNAVATPAVVNVPLSPPAPASSPSPPMSASPPPMLAFQETERTIARLKTLLEDAERRIAILEQHKLDLEAKVKYLEQGPSLFDSDNEDAQLSATISQRFSSSPQPSPTMPSNQPKAAGRHSILAQVFFDCGGLSPRGVCVGIALCLPT